MECRRSLAVAGIVLGCVCMCVCLQKAQCPTRCSHITPKLCEGTQSPSSAAALGLWFFVLGVEGGGMTVRERCYKSALKGSEPC